MGKRWGRPLASSRKETGAKCHLVLAREKTRLEGGSERNFSGEGRRKRGFVKSILRDGKLSQGRLGLSGAEYRTG